MLIDGVAPAIDGLYPTYASAVNVVHNGVHILAHINLCVYLVHIDILNNIRIFPLLKWSKLNSTGFESDRSRLQQSCPARAHNGRTKVCIQGFCLYPLHDDVIKWNDIPRNCPFVRGIHRSPVNSSHKGQWRGALMFFLICAWINNWVDNREAGESRRHRAHYDVIVMAGNACGLPVPI